MAVDETHGQAGTQDERNARRTRHRIPRTFSAIGSQIIGAIVTTVTLSFGFMVLNDYVFPPPDIAGRWKITIVHEDIAYRPFPEFKVTYQTLLIQEGLELSGTGEKLSDLGPECLGVDCTGDKRASMQVIGNVTCN